MEHVHTAQPEHYQERLFSLLKEFALSHKEVTLASGQKSSLYLDCRQVYFRGEAHFLIGELFWHMLNKFEKSKQVISACGGMAMGSIPLSLALSAAAFRRGRELPGFAVRKEAKEHGMKELIEGNKCLNANTHALIVEDVVTSGGSALKAIESVRQHGVQVSTLFALVDREQGGKEKLQEQGVELYSIFTLSDFMRN